MRAGRLAAAVVVAVAIVGAAAASGAAPKPTFAWSGRALRITAPGPGHVSIGVVKLHVKTTSRTAPRLTVAGLKGHPGIVVLFASHLAWAKGYATRTVLFAIVNRNARKTSVVDDEGYGELSFAADLIINGGEGALVELVRTAYPQRFNRRRAEEQMLADEASHQAAERAVAGFDTVLESPDPWTPKPSEAAALDTGYYDDGHAFGWKPQSPQLAKDLIHLETHGDDWVDGIDKLIGDLTTFGPSAPAPSPQPTYTCSGPNTLLFDNWNTSPAANGGTAPTFDTGGKAYCINETATYHWNGGAGAAPGTISIVQGGKTLAAWTSVGQAPDGSPGNINWVANIPAGSPPVVVKGSFSCHDSSPATWAQNAASKHAGFCRVWGQVATPS